MINIMITFLFSVVKTLLTAGADIEVPNCEGNTPLLR